MNLVLPWPPTANLIWRTRCVGSGKSMHAATYLSAEGKAYRATVQRIVARLGIVAPLTGRISLSIAATMPDRRRRDLDNLLKASLDALTHAGVWVDDNQVDELRISRGDVAADGVGLLHVAIEVLPEVQAALPLPKPPAVRIEAEYAF